MFLSGAPFYSASIYYHVDITSIYLIIHFNSYADNTQLYLLTRPTSTVSLFSLSRNSCKLCKINADQTKALQLPIAIFIPRSFPSFRLRIVISSSTVGYNSKPTCMMSIGLRIFINIILTASANQPHASAPQFPFTICIDYRNSLPFGLSLSCLPIDFNWSGTLQVASSPETPQLIISLLFSSMSAGSQSNTALMRLIDATPLLLNLLFTSTSMFDLPARPPLGLELSAALPATSESPFH